MGQSFQYGVVVCLTKSSHLKSLCPFIVLIFMFTYFELYCNKDLADPYTKDLAPDLLFASLALQSLTLKTEAMTQSK